MDGVSQSPLSRIFRTPEYEAKGKERHPSLFLWSSYFRPSSYGRATSVPLPTSEAVEYW